MCCTKCPSAQSIINKLIRFWSQSKDQLIGINLVSDFCNKKLITLPIMCSNTILPRISGQLWYFCNNVIKLKD